jgi:hypothetical protein
MDSCETCGEVATHWDYDQLKFLCAEDIQQPEFTIRLIPIEEMSNVVRPVPE